MDLLMVAVNTSFFSDLLQSIADRSRSLISRREPDRGRSDGIAELCEALLSGRGEASGVALADEILADYGGLTTRAADRLLRDAGADIGHDRARIEAAIAACAAIADGGKRGRPAPRQRAAAARAVPPLNLAPGGTAALVRMREQLLDALDHRDDLAIVDDDFVHLFSSWFNRGFLVLRRIDWSTPASILERSSATRRCTIRDWEDLRRRVDPPDRRCYAFFIRPWSTSR